MNLIRDPWMPTDQGFLAPASALLSASSFNWGRGDWDAASQVLLIGLLQTALIRNPAICPDEEMWQELLDSPPSSDQIASWLKPLEPIFSGSAFEDFEELADSKEVPIAFLFPECPKENTVKLCRDIAQWHENVEKGLPEAEAKIALLADNMWGMGIGTGFKQGPRGGSRMTVFVEPNDAAALIWHRVWLNILSHERWLSIFKEAPWDESLIFPWTCKTQTKPVTMANAHPLTIYWTMPRRNRLVDAGESSITHYRRSNGGPDYVGWRHPLSPYRATDSGPIALKIVPEHLGFNDWAGFALINSGSTAPSVLVNEFLQYRMSDDMLRLRCVGWSSKNAEAIAWVQHTVPLIINADTEQVEDLLEFAEMKRKRLYICITNVLANSSSPSQAKFLAREAGNLLYSRTEALFYKLVRGKSDEGWSKKLKEVSVDLFYETTGKFNCDPMAVARQRLKL